MLARKTVVFTTFDRDDPAASRIARMFSSTRRVCAAMSPSIIWLINGSIGIWPAVNIKLPARIACEYGPIACGASSVTITVRFVGFGAAERDLAEWVGLRVTFFWVAMLDLL